MGNFLVDPIYMQVDLLLILWTLGIAVNGVGLLVQKRNLKSAATAFWNEENFLFGSWAEKKRLAIGSRLFLLAAILLQIQTFFLMSSAKENWPFLFQALQSIVGHVLGVCLILKIVFFGKYSGKQLFVAWPAFFVFRWTFVNNHLYWFAIGTLFLFAAKEIQLKQTLKACLIAGAISMMTVFVGVATKVIPVGWFETAPGCIRPGIGYGWPNMLGAYLLALAVMYSCWRGVKQFRWFDFAILVSLEVLCAMGPRSKGAAVALLLLIVGLAVAKWLPALFANKPVKILIATVPVMALGVSYWMSAAYTPENAVLSKMNNLFTGRIYLGNTALRELSVRIAGQRIPAEYVVDNVYLMVLIAAGPIASIFLWGANSKLLWKLSQSGHTTEIICVLAFLAHGFMEGHILWPSVNVLIWLLAGVFYRSKTEEFPTFAENPLTATEKGEEK